MTFSRDEILKAWDAAVARVARNHEDPTDEEIAAVAAVVCAKLPGLTDDDVNNALRSSIEEEKRTIVSAERLLQILKNAVGKREDKALPGLPGGPPLIKH